jgi:hypothetical protein
MKISNVSCPPQNGFRVHLRTLSLVISRNKILVGKPERKRPLGRYRSRRKDNINMGLKKIGWENNFEIKIKVKLKLSP